MSNRFVRYPGIRRIEQVLIRYIDMVRRTLGERVPRVEKSRLDARDASAVDAGRLFHGERGARKELRH
jgi:hypothetical protein